MKLISTIKKLRNTKLKQLSKIDKTDEVVIEYINMAVVAIYNRYQLRTEEAILKLKADKTEYSLDGTDPDVEMTSTEEIGQFVEAFDSSGIIGINNDYSDFGIFTISYNKVQVPIVNNGEFISIIYQPIPADVEYVDDGNGNATEADIALPGYLLEPLLHYVGYVANESVNGNKDGEENKHYTRFVSSCDRIDALGLVPTDGYSRPINLKGF